MPYRIVLTTHHITSPRKLRVLRAAASEHRISALLKTGRPPGIMLCEGETEGVNAWHAVVKRLRYKDYRYMGGGDVPSRELREGQVGMGEVQSAKVMGEIAEREGWRGWWREKMGWK